MSATGKENVGGLSTTITGIGARNGIMVAASAMSVSASTPVVSVPISPREVSVMKAAISGSLMFLALVMAACGIPPLRTPQRPRVSEQTEW